MADNENKRQVILDTETTGLEPREGHRIIEIGALELVERRPTGKSFHHYLNPDREIEQGAQQVHGLSNSFLEDKPRFAEIAEQLIEFCRDAELIIHNADFDIGFIHNEMRICTPELGKLTDYCSVLDSLALARELHPGQRNSLDALCRRYDIDNSSRTLHGALLDAELLQEVYLAMTGGQSALELGTQDHSGQGGSADLPDGLVLQAVAVKVPEPELELHRQRLAAIEKASEHGLVWGMAENKPS